VTAAAADEAFLARLPKHRTKFVSQNAVRTSHRQFRHLRAFSLVLSAAVSDEIFSDGGLAGGAEAFRVLFDETVLGREQITLVELPADENGSIVQEGWPNGGSLRRKTGQFQVSPRRPDVRHPSYGEIELLLDGTSNIRKDVVRVRSDETDGADNDDEDDGQHNSVFRYVLSVVVIPEVAQ